MVKEFINKDQREKLDAFGSMKYELDQLSRNLQRNNFPVQTENNDLSLRISGEYAISEINIADGLFAAGKESFGNKLAELANRAIKSMGEKAGKEISGISTEKYMAVLQREKQGDCSEKILNYRKCIADWNTRIEKEVFSFASPSIGATCSITGALNLTSIEVDRKFFYKENKSKLSVELANLLNKAIIEIRNRTIKELMECRGRAFM
jgi:DNA-binding protein YbaB